MHPVTAAGALSRVVAGEWIWYVGGVAAEPCVDAQCDQTAAGWFESSPKLAGCIPHKFAVIRNRIAAPFVTRQLRISAEEFSLPSDEVRLEVQVSGCQVNVKGKDLEQCKQDSNCASGHCFRSECLSNHSEAKVCVPSQGLPQGTLTCSIHAVTRVAVQATNAVAMINALLESVRLHRTKQSSSHQAESHLISLQLLPDTVQERQPLTASSIHSSRVPVSH